MSDRETAGGHFVDERSGWQLLDVGISPKPPSCNGRTTDARGRRRTESRHDPLGRPAGVSDLGSYCERFRIRNAAWGLNPTARLLAWGVTDTLTPSTPHDDSGAAHDGPVRTLIGRITRLEVVVGTVILAVMLLLVLLEPDILEAPFENERTLLFTVGGTVLAAVAFVAMLWFRVPAIIRVIVLVVPFVLVNWWLISPYFIDDVVDESFATSISEQAVAPTPEPTTPVTVSPTTLPNASTGSTPPASVAAPVTSAPTTAPPPPSGPVLLGAGQFVGLAGHSGTGDAGLFQNPDGSLVLRFENFDIENGPDLEVYLVPGADQASLPAGSIGLGELKGNIGDQNYDLPRGTELAPGAYTALVWCEAFSVEFVGATITI